MSKSAQEIENMIVQLGCNSNRVSLNEITSKISSVEFSTVELCGTRFMYCGIKMDNDFVVTGEPSACIDPANWREEVGQRVSFENAFSNIWRLEAYRKMST